MHRKTTDAQRRGNPNGSKRATDNAQWTDRIVSLRAVMERTGLGRSAIYELAKSGRFPRPFKLGAKATGWSEKEVEAWCAALPRSGDSAAA